MKEEEFRKRHEEMEALSEKARGRILDACITIENLISTTLTGFFSIPDKNSLFDRYIMSDMLDFEKKKTIINSLIKEGEFQLKYSYPEFSKDLNDIQLLRNIIAHTTLNTTKEKIEKFDSSQLDYVSFSRKKYELEIVVYMNRNDASKEDITKGIYSFTNFIDRANNIKKVLD